MPPLHAVARWLTRLLALALAVGLSGGPASAAQETSGAGWEASPLAGPVLQLFTPAGGAVFARTATGLVKSDDAGLSWTALSLPPIEAEARAWQVEVDPTNQAVLYLSGRGGLFKSADGGASWTLLLPTERHAARLAVSPAEPSTLYLGQVRTPGISSDFWFLRSRDGGVSWEQLEEHHNSLCGWGVPILLPHPTDPQRLFRTANCLAGRDFGDALSHSADQGSTWTRVFAATRLDAADPRLAYPARLVGGRGAAPARFYLAANRDARFGGSSLFRTDDEGQAWSEVLAHRGGGTTDRPSEPNVRLGGLAYDPAEPERLYLGLNAYQGQGAERTLAHSGVQASADGGHDWTDLPGPPVGTINDLALAIDGRTLYLAAELGLWRLRLDRAAAPAPPVQLPPGRASFARAGAVPS